MKLSAASRFPHPVLSVDTSDYRDAEFGMEVTYSEDFALGQLTLSCNQVIRCPSVENLLQKGQIVLALSIACRATYYREILELDSNGQVVLPLEEFFDRVELTPLLIAAEEISSYNSDTLSEEFRQPLEFHKGDLVGYAPTMVISVGRLKLEKFDSIFQLSEVDDLRDGEVAVDIDSEKIQIQMNPAMKQLVDGLRVNTAGQKVLLSSVYMPAVMEVLSILASDSGAGGGRRWREVFAAKCDRLGIKPEKSDTLLRDAQRLLHFPVPVSLTAISEEEST